MFSVVIPLYNKELSISNTIQSVLNQTFQDFEIVVVNDGSTDNSLHVLKEIDDTRIRIINKTNGGVSSARNRGIKEAKYEWIAFLDGDDLWEPNHLEEITKMMNLYPEEKVFVTSFVYSDNRQMFKHPRATPIFKIENYFKEAIKENLMWTSIVVVNKECIDKVGGFNEKLNRGEDLDLWARLAREYAITKSSIVTAIYRVEAENRSSASFNIERSRVFNYEFKKSESTEETYYYKSQVVSSLRGFLVQKKFNHFVKLYLKHRKHISLASILKVKAL